ncbi:MAG TPA: VCBS repeat-containing protein [Ktedonobacteraceae bacterium]
MTRQNASTGNPVPRRASLPSMYPNQNHREETEEDDEDDWSLKMPRSAIRYTTTNRTPVITSGNRRYILHEGVPPQHTPPLPRQEKETVRPRHRVHWSLILGTGMMVMFVLWVLGNMLINWWNVTQDDIHYGRPRTFQIDQRVGHNDDQTPSHFIAINLNRRIEIIEFPGGDAAHAKVYVAMTLFGDGEDLAVVTLSFKDVNGDGKPDMMVTVGNTHYVFINDSGQFRPLKPGEQIHP